eukprot:TRINITY_DN9248_c0_g2_i3.p1 TRINITY_DN9248_c0_g2~~TRINITY_DN9248_c0_g2_i3.p1  ORF type:complete len:115 (-),score=23.80 TRINITY_DN9248_c0_g2_i3:104-448(-)
MKRVHYNVDGTGRDFYIRINDVGTNRSGETSPNASFVTNLRRYEGESASPARATSSKWRHKEQKMFDQQQKTIERLSPPRVYGLPAPEDIASRARSRSVMTGSPMKNGKGRFVF